MYINTTVQCNTMQEETRNKQEEYCNRACQTVCYPSPNLEIPE